MKRAGIVAFVVVIASSNAGAATVFKCVDDAGKITFTQQNCPNASSYHGAIQAHSPTISGAGPAVEMAPPRRQGTSAEISNSPSRISVIGASAPQPECSTGLNDRDLRTAKVRGEIVPGMSRGEIEQMYENPGRNAGARGAGSSTYWNDKYVDQTTVRYDRSGCVSSSYQSGSSRKP